MKLNEMTKESLQKLEKAMVGETVEVEGRTIKVKRYKEGDCAYCIGGRICGTVACTSNIRTDNTSVYFSDVTAESKPDPIEYLTTREAARRLGVTMEKVQEMARRGDIKGHKAGELAGMRGTVWRLEKASVDAARKATDRVMSEGPREVRFGDHRLVLGVGVADTLHRLRRAADFAANGGCHFEPEPEPDPAMRLLPFEDVDEHRIWPLAVYKLEKSDESGCVDFCVLPIERLGVMASGTYGNRAQAVEACRNDLRIRLKAVDELREGCK